MRLQNKIVRESCRLSVRLPLLVMDFRRPCFYYTPGSAKVKRGRRKKTGEHFNFFIVKKNNTLCYEKYVLYYFITQKKRPVMEISFATKKLEQCAKDLKTAKREWGEKRTAIFFKRITTILAANTFEDLRHVPGHFHELTGDRKGQWGCDLDQPYRLIITPPQDSVDRDAQGNFIWTKISRTVVVEIVNYHKER